MKTFKRTRFACFFAYLSMSSVFVLPPMLFVTFHEMYNISYTLLGTLVLINFCSQLIIDLIFTFFSKHFNIALTVRIMPLLTFAGLVLYALLPNIFPEHAFWGLSVGTVIFSIAAGLCEVLLSPLVAAIPSSAPEKDMSMLHSLYGWGVVSVVIISTVFFKIFGTEKWVYLTLVLSVLPLIASGLFFASPIPETKTESEKAKGKSNTKALALCSMCIFLGSAAENTMTNWISSFMESALGLSKSVGDVLGLAVFALLLAATRSLYAKYAPNIFKTLIISMCGAAVCYIITGVSSNIILSFVAAILIGVFTSMLWPGTLILMEERAKNPGVAAFALMAAAGDFGASVAPQLLGIVVDKASESSFSVKLIAETSHTADEIGFKAGMLIAAVFPLIGIFVLVRFLPKGKS